MRRSTSSTLRRLVGTSAVVVATVVVPAGVAAAADYPNGGNPPTNVQGTSTVKAETATRGGSSSTLPFTGGDVAGLALIGAGAAIAGTVMVRRSRRPLDA
jgi:hypothetical protein